MNEMPSKKQYDLVSDDGYDSRIPLHNEDAFAHGIQFGAKYIGTLDVPRPSSRVEIVAAMRRIRYEFKAKAIKKKKVTLTVSVDGVKVMMRKKKKKSQWHWDDNRLMVMHHPIYRIFYVSHDSQDLKIWSYIARDGSTNVFKCNVFKAYKKNQAMRIVRTIGQAFEVCHKLSVSNITNNSENQEDVEGSEHSDEVEQKNKHKEAHLESEVKGNNSVGSPGSQKSSSILPTELALKQAQQLLNSMEAKTPGETITSPLGSPVLLGEVTPNPELPLSSHHQLQLLRQQLEQQQQQTQVAIAQVHLLKDQLAAETAARIEAQARTHQLLLHNRDLLDHASTLINRIQELEVKISGISTVSEVVFQTPPQVQIPVLPDPTTPQAGPVYLPEFQELDMSYLQTVPDIAMFKNTKTDLDTDSPDSGHKEMSSDSLSLNLHQSENSWHSTTGNNGSGLSNPYNKTPVSINCSQNGFHTPPSQPLGRHCASMSTSFSQSNGLYNPFSYSDSSYSNGSSSTFNATPSPSCDVEDKVKIITPLPPQDASGNRLDLGQNTPKIEPPPQNKRSVRPGHMNLSRDKTGYRDNNANISNNREYYSAHTTVNTGSIRDATPWTWANLCREFAHNHSHSRSHNLNNNYEADSKIIYETGSNFQASQDLTTNVVNGHESNRPTTLNDVMDVRLHITNPSDDENSEDSGLPPHNLPRRLDSMTFDEFDALSN